MRISDLHLLSAALSARGYALTVDIWDRHFKIALSARGYALAVAASLARYAATCRRYRLRRYAPSFLFLHYVVANVL